MITNQVSVPGYKICEKLYDGSRTLVYQGYREDDQKAVVIKLLKNPYPSFSELVQFRNQYTIAKNLNVPGIIQTYGLEPYQNGYALVMEDFGGISLDLWRGRGEERRMGESSQTLIEFLQIAISLCDTLDILFHHRIIHKDIKPANILINPQTKQIKLIDFSIASLLPRESQVLISPNVLEGTLGYLSPEQTGRMNRGIDYRTDFYSLGVTFYELLTGELPFQSDDAMELVHCHIAEKPPTLHEINSKIPPVLSEMISKLMAKNAEDRYQTALGLKYDLETCLYQIKETGNIKYFEIGQRDLCDRFTIPEKLYGRNSEVQALLDAFDRVSNLKSIAKSKTNPKSEIMLVAGFSGIGKTAIVNEVHKPIARHRGYFIKGKFDQFNRNIPFSAFVKAFRDLTGQLLSENDTKLSSWKNKILQALGENGQIIIDVIPELENIIGQQPPYTELSGTAAQNRFNLLFQKFIKVFTAKEHPLVIFLDDLQWADSASLNLMQLLMSESESGYLLLIGTYRDNEVSAAHPLMLTLEEIRKANATINTITLAPLSEESLNKLVADTLSCPEDIALPLTQLIYQKTKGNPFFSTQFLKALYEDGFIEFKRTQSPLQKAGRKGVGGWRCNIADVKALALTDDVVEFMALQLQKVPETTQNVLKLAACIGNQFDLTTLAIVSQKSETETATNLWKALQEGLILPTSEIYKFYVERGTQDLAPREQTVTYKFLHDRVQQAAYSLIPDNEKQATHLLIGQLLLDNSSLSQQEENIFEIVNHLNIGAELISDITLINRLVGLNLSAGKKAKQSTAYTAASQYFDKGIKLLPSSAWQSQYNLTLTLHNEIVEAFLLMTHFEQMEQWAQVVLNNAKTVLDKVKVYTIHIQGCIAQNNLLLAEQTALIILKQLGIEFPNNPTEAEVETIFCATQSKFDSYSVEELVRLPAMTNPNYLAAMEILVTVVSAFYQSASKLFPLIVSKQIDLSLEYGNSPVSASSYSWYGLMQASSSGNLDISYKAGETALLLVADRQNDSLKAKAMNITHAFVMHWKRHGCHELPSLLETHQIALETGELEYGACALYNYTAISLYIGRNLYEMEKETETFDRVLTQLRQGTSLCYLQITRQTVLNLCGKANNPCLLVGDAYNEDVMLPLHQANRVFYAICTVYLNKLILNYLFQHYEQALEYWLLAEQYSDAVTAAFKYSLIYFYGSLALLASYPTAASEKQGTILRHVTANQEKARRWAHYAPMNHWHKFYLVEAELCRVLRKNTEAMELYDKAIIVAQENQYLNEEALANELAAKFYLEWGKEKIAQVYIQSAYYCYARWGAKAKTRDLEKRYPQLLVPILQAQQNRFYLNDTRHQTVQISCSTSMDEAIDFATIMKASQALSGEIQLDKLLSILMQVVMQNAGAKKAALLLLKNNQLIVEALATMGEGVQLLQMPCEKSTAIPSTVINYVKRSLKTVVLDDATAQNNFIADPYLIEQQPKSLLCAPMLCQGQLTGLLYLENKLTIGVFTSQRLEVIQLLCTQAAISLENARLYQESQNYAKQLENSLKELKQAQLQMVQSEKMATLGSLVAGVAHEINNPIGFLTGSINNASEYIKDILTHVECYQQHHPTPSDAVSEHALEIDLEFLNKDLPKLVDSMRLATQRIKDISTSLRTFSRADTTEKVACSIHEGINSTLLILKYRLKANEKRPAIGVITEYGNLPPVKCFLGQLNQVFMNILANAIDALDTSTSGRTFADIQANLPQIKIITEVGADNNTVLIRIIDNAFGMPEEIKARIFDHLFTTKEVGKGTGLGLAIARQIVEDTHTGKLTCNSTLGKGTEFIIQIPI